MKYRITSFVVLLLCASPAQAASIYKEALPATQAAATTIATQRHSEQSYDYPAPGRLRGSALRRSKDKPVFGNISLGLGIAGVGCAVLALTGGSVFWAVPALVFALGAIVFGAIGMKHNKRIVPAIGLLLGCLLLVVASFAAFGAAAWQAANFSFF
jgi:hypothetical protein